jgi:uncharacterized membrane protein
MEGNPDQPQTSYGNYTGYAYQPSALYAGPEEMPQSSYPHEGDQPPPQNQQQQYAYSQQQQYNYQYPSSAYQNPYSAPAPGDVDPLEKTSLGMRARTAGWLSYLLFWVSGLIFFLLERDNRFVRFHAMQAILFFGGFSLLETIVSFIPFSGSLNSGLGCVEFVCWIVLMIAASRGKYFKLPVIGDYAEQLANRIR